MSNKTIFAIGEEIKKHQLEISQLEARLEVARAEPISYELARELHELTCHQNHTEGCGWFYETNKGIDNWSGESHKFYLHRANLLLNACESDGVNIELVLKYFHLVRGY